MKTKNNKRLNKNTERIFAGNYLNFFPPKCERIFQTVIFYKTGLTFKKLFVVAYLYNRSMSSFSFNRMKTKIK